MLSQAIPAFVSLPTYLSSNVIAGPDGDLWAGVTPTFTSAAIDRIGLDGSVTSFPVPENAPASDFSFVSLVDGPDGNIWFEANDTNPTTGAGEILIGNVTSTGQVTELPPISLKNNDFFYATPGMVSGPDGDLWLAYTDLGYDATTSAAGRTETSFIVRVTPAGTMTTFPLPPSITQSSAVESLADGPGGNLWFTAGYGKRFVVGQMSPSGIATRSSSHGLTIGRVVSAPGQSLVLSGQNSQWQNEVFSVSATDTVERFKIPSELSSSFTTILGSADGSLWFVNAPLNPVKLGQITATGKVTSHDLSHLIPGRENNIRSIALGGDGNLYVTDTLYGRPTQIDTLELYRLSPSQLPTSR